MYNSNEKHKNTKKIGIILDKGVFLLYNIGILTQRTKKYDD